MTKKGSKIFNRSAFANTNTFEYYFNKLCELKLTVFNWINLPPTVDPRFLELTLLTEGKILFFEDDVVGYLSLPFTSGGNLNIYHNPTIRNAYSTGYYHSNLKESNSVIIYNNYMRTNDILSINMYADRLSLIQNAIDINIKLQKTPKILKVPEDMRLSLQNLLMDYAGNIPFLLGEKNIDQISVATLDLTSPYIADKLYDLLTVVWNDALKSLGIINYYDNKKERNISTEIYTKLGDTNSIRISMLKPREYACEQINKMFGLSVSVIPSNFPFLNSEEST